MAREARTYFFREFRGLDLGMKTDHQLIAEGILGDTALLCVVGPAKTYKSFLLNTIAVDLLTGRNLFGAYRVPHKNAVKAFEVIRTCRVLICEQELGECSLLDRLLPLYKSLTPTEQALVDKNLAIHSADPDLMLDSAGGYTKLERELEAVQPQVLILDPFTDFHNSDENSTTLMSRLLHKFARLQQKFAPLAIIFSHHEGIASSAREGVRRLRGNTVVGGKVDGVIIVSIRNRTAMQIRLDFVLRRDKPVDSLYLQFDDNLRANYLCWNKDPKKSQKLANLDAEEIDATVQ